MARAGDVIEHPGTGEQITFRKTARETGGMELVLEFTMRPGGFVAGAHVHPNQEERFDVLEGTVRFRVDGQERDAGPGQTVVVPAGVRHVWWNPGATPARLIVRFGPALRTEEFFEVFFGLAKDGKSEDRAGRPAPIGGDDLGIPAGDPPGLTAARRASRTRAGPGGHWAAARLPARLPLSPRRAAGASLNQS